MNLEQIVKETVAKIVAEKILTAAEEKKREEIVMAMKKDFKGPAPAMYAIATDKAKKLAEEDDHEVSMAQRSLDSILRSAMELKAKIGNQEIDIPAWIQDHITNSETYIDQASQGYHEYHNDGEHGKMDEGNLNHNEVSSIEQEGRFWIVTYQTADGTKEKSFESEDEARAFYNGLDESQEITSDELAQLQSTADDTSKMPAERDAARNKIYASRAKKESQQELNEDKMDKEELKQAQIDKAYDHLEKMKENTKLFSKDDIKKAESRIEKLEAELDALADKATNESLDEATVRRWQHYAGIK
jgi:hypothetical protein